MAPEPERPESPGLAGPATRVGTSQGGQRRGAHLHLPFQTHDPAAPVPARQMGSRAPGLRGSSRRAPSSWEPTQCCASVGASTSFVKITANRRSAHPNAASQRKPGGTAPIPDSLRFKTIFKLLLWRCLQSQFLRHIKKAGHGHLSVLTKTIISTSLDLNYSAKKKAKMDYYQRRLFFHVEQTLKAPDTASKGSFVEISHLLRKAIPSEAQTRAQGTGKSPAALTPSHAPQKLFHLRDLRGRFYTLGTQQIETAFLSN